MNQLVVQQNQIEGKLLNDKQIYALLTIEENRDKLVSNEFVQAQQQLQVAENNLEVARTGLTEVRGAIVGANIFIERELAAAGLTLKDWENIKATIDRGIAEQAAKEAPPVDQPAAEEEAVIPNKPPTNVADYKRRRK